MSKTVLLPDELYKEIQETDVEIHWVKVDQSMAKKIKLFFDVYKLEKMIDEWTETYSSFKEKNRGVMNDIEDERIRIDTWWKNPWLIQDATI